jgi:flagellar basal-body rod protein FlgC
MINFLTGIQSSSAALAAERVRMEVISDNLANAEVPRGLDGKLYQRKQVVFEAALNQAQGLGGDSPTLIKVGKITNDPSPPRLIYDPSSPYKDAKGMVELPAIDIHTEMADLIASSRAFEANLAVVKNSRQMALQALSIGNR